MNDVITLSGVELLALGKEARQRYSYMDYEIIYKLEEVIRNALTDYSSIFAVRVDLRFTEPEVGCPDSPVCFQNAEGQVMKRFIASLKSQLRAYDERRKRTGVRVHPTKLRYLWVCEQDEAELPHYHLLILCVYLITVFHAINGVVAVVGSPPSPVHVIHIIPVVSIQIECMPYSSVIT